MKLKKILAFCLALSLLLGMLPMTVFAENGEADGAETPAGTVQESETSETGDEPLESGDPAMIDETPDSQTPAAGGQTPADGGQTPTEGGETPVGDGQTPADGGQEGQEAGDGGQTPPAEGQTPSDGGQTPDEEGQQPTPCEKCNTAHEGDCPAPEAGQETPEPPDADEGQTPPAVCETCGQAPHEGECVACADCNEYHIIDPNFTGCLSCMAAEGHGEGCEFYQEPREPFSPAIDFTNAAPQVCDLPAGPVTRMMRSKARAAAETEEASLVMKKEVTQVQDGDGNYTLTLEAYATGKTVTVQNYKEKPTDIVLLIDKSGSNAICYKCNVYMTRQKRSHLNALLLAERKYLDADFGHDYNKLEGSVVTTCEQKLNKDIITQLDTSKTYWIYDYDVNSWISEVKEKAEDEYYGFVGGINRQVYRKVKYCTSCKCWHREGENKEHSQLRKYQQAYGSGHGSNNTPQNGTYYAYFYDITEDQLCVSRYIMMENATSAFMADVAERSKGKHGKIGTYDDADHKIAILTFDNGGTQRTGLLPVLDPATGGVNSNLTNAIKAFRPDGGTRTDLGMEEAKKLILNLEEDPGRTRMVILLTDGVPEGNMTINGKVVAVEGAPHVVNGALANADEIKNGNVTVYSIGIFTGADGSNPAKRVAAQDWDAYFKTQAAKDTVNTFMHLLSSNYNGAKSMVAIDANGAATVDNYSSTMKLNPNLNGMSYYLSASSTESLKEAFTQIAAGVGTTQTPTSQLSSTTVVKDVVTPYFTVPSGSEIKAYTLDYTGDNKAGEKQWSTEKKDVTTLKVAQGASSSGPLSIQMQVNDDRTTTVDVSNFDFGEHYVGMDEHTDSGVTTQTPHGKKLVIEIKIKPDPSFVGGNHVETNTDNSGIYTPDASGNYNPVDDFEIPKVDVPVKNEGVNPEPATGHAGSTYLEYMSLKELQELITLKAGDITLQLGQENYGLEDWQTDYSLFKVELFDTQVDEEGFVVRDQEGKAVTEGEALTEEDRLTIRKDHVVVAKLFIWSKLDKDGNPQEMPPEDVTPAVVEIPITVYYPTFTFSDGRAYYGEELEDVRKAYGEVDANKYLTWYTNGQYDKFLEKMEQPTVEEVQKQIKENPDHKYYPIEQNTAFNDEPPTIKFEVDPVRQEVVDAFAEWDMTTDAPSVAPGAAVDNNAPVHMGKEPVAMNVRVYFKDTDGSYLDNPIRNSFFLHAKDGQVICDSITTHKSGGQKNMDTALTNELRKTYWIPEFYVHPEFCSITIVKTGGAADEPYVFEVYKEGKLYTEATIVGNSKVTIYELPIGSYEVKEKTEWSWRYPEPTVSWKYNDSEEQTTGTTFQLKPNEKEDDVTVTFANKKSNNFWLNGYSQVKTNTYIPKAG